jgi:hypothetical protein
MRVPPRTEIESLPALQADRRNVDLQTGRREKEKGTGGMVPREGERKHGGEGYERSNGRYNRH